MNIFSSSLSSSHNFQSLSHTHKLWHKDPDGKCYLKAVRRKKRLEESAGVCAGDGEAERMMKEEEKRGVEEFHLTHSSAGCLFYASVIPVLPLQQRYKTVKTTCIGSRLLINEASCHVWMPNTICIPLLTHTHTNTRMHTPLAFLWEKMQSNLELFIFSSKSYKQANMSDQTSPISSLPQEPSADWLCFTSLQHAELNIITYCITKAAFCTIEQKQFRQRNPLHMSIEAIIGTQGEVEQK